MKCTRVITYVFAGYKRSVRPVFTVLCTSEDRRRATVQKEERARGVRARVAVVVVLHHCRRPCVAEEGGRGD